MLTNHVHPSLELAMSYDAPTNRLSIFPQGSAVNVLNALRRSTGAVGTALARLSVLPCDTRESLHTKEEQLARYGVSWSTDIAHDAELAAELAASRQRCLAGVVAAPPLIQPVALLSEADEIIDTPATSAWPACMGVS